LCFLPFVIIVVPLLANETLQCFYVFGEIKNTLFIVHFEIKYLDIYEEICA